MKNVTSANIQRKEKIRNNEILIYDLLTQADGISLEILKKANELKELKNLEGSSSLKEVRFLVQKLSKQRED